MARWKVKKKYKIEESPIINQQSEKNLESSSLRIISDQWHLISEWVEPEPAHCDSREGANAPGPGWTCQLKRASEKKVLRV